MPGISASQLERDGIHAPTFFYADRIVAGLADMPADPDADLIATINYLKEQNVPRKKQSITPPATVEMNEEAVRKDVHAADTMAVIAAGTEDAMRLGRAIGQMETAHFYQTISHSVMLSAYEEAKKSKAYRLLINPETQTHFGSLEEFCEVRLGVGYERMRQIAGNRNLLGQETFEQAERLGLHQVDYNAIKALPAPTQEIIRQAIAEGTSRDDVVIALEKVASLAAEQQKKVEELEADAEATGKLLEAKNKKIDDLSKARKKKLDPWPDEVAGLKDDLHTLSKVLDEALGKHLTIVDAATLEIDRLEEGTDAHTGYKTVVHHLGESIERICALAAGLRAEFETKLAGYIALDKTHTLDA